jgi:hypothetical protein
MDSYILFLPFLIVIYVKNFIFYCISDQGREVRPQRRGLPNQTRPEYHYEPTSAGLTPNPESYHTWNFGFRGERVQTPGLMRAEMWALIWAFLPFREYGVVMCRTVP